MRILLRQSGQDTPDRVITGVLYFEPFIDGKDSYIQFTTRKTLKQGVQLIRYNAKRDTYTIDGVHYDFCEVNWRAK